MLTPAIPCAVSGYTAVNVDTAMSKRSMAGRMTMLHSKRRFERSNSVGIYFFHNESKFENIINGFTRDNSQVLAALFCPNTYGICLTSKKMN